MIAIMTDRRRVVLEWATRQLEAGLDRPSPNAIARAAGITVDAAKADILALRRMGLLPKSPITAARIASSRPRSPRASTTNGDLARDVAELEIEEARVAFEAAARDYEAERASGPACGIAVRVAHDRLRDALGRYAELSGLFKCAFNGWRYVPDPAERSFIRELDRRRVGH